MDYHHSKLYKASNAEIQLTPRKAAIRIRSIIGTLVDDLQC